MKKLIFLGLIVLSQLSYATARIDRNYVYYPQVNYSYGYQAPRLGDMDLTFLWGAGGALAGNGLAYLFGGNRTTGTILGGLLGLFAGYQEDKSENIERSHIVSTRDDVYVFDDCWGTNTKSSRSTTRRGRTRLPSYRSYEDSSRAGMI